MIESSRAGEFLLLETAAAAGVAVPRVRWCADESEGLGSAFVMDFVAGETIARRLLRDAEYAKARDVLPEQLAAALVRIHAMDASALGELTRPEAGTTPAAAELARFEGIHRAIAPDPHPAFELALRWLATRLPPSQRQTVVHGDYRVGNVIVGPEGLRAVIDWELTHVGDPMEDVGWLCVRSWRFGAPLPVGGLLRARALLRRLRARRRRAGRSGRGALVGGVRQPALGHHDAHAGADLSRRRAQRRAREPRAPDVRDGAGAARSDGRRSLTMQDRPSVSELLRAVREFLEDDLVPALEGRRRFHALVAANVLAIVERELDGEEEQLARQWDRLAALFQLDPAIRPGAPSALRPAIRDSRRASSSASAAARRTQVTSRPVFARMSARPCWRSSRWRIRSISRARARLCAGSRAPPADALGCGGAASAAPRPRSAGCARGSRRSARRLPPACGRGARRCRSAAGAPWPHAW